MNVCSAETGRGSKQGKASVGGSTEVLAGGGGSGSSGQGREERFWQGEEARARQEVKEGKVKESW